MQPTLAEELASLASGLARVSAGAGLRRSLADWVIKEMYVAAAVALTTPKARCDRLEVTEEIERTRRLAGVVLGLPGKAGNGDITSALAARGDTELAKEYSEFNKGRRALVHTEAGLAGRVEGALRKPRTKPARNVPTTKATCREEEVPVQAQSAESATTDRQTKHVLLPMQRQPGTETDTEQPTKNMTVNKKGSAEAFGPKDTTEGSEGSHCQSAFPSPVPAVGGCQQRERGTVLRSAVLAALRDPKSWPVRVAYGQDPAPELQRQPIGIAGHPH